MIALNTEQGAHVLTYVKVRKSALHLSGIARVRTILIMNYKL